MELVAYYKGIVTPWLRAHIGRDSETGAALVEYALLLSLIAVVCLVAVMFLGQSTSQKFSSVGSQLQ